MWDVITSRPIPSLNIELNFLVPLHNSHIMEELIQQWRKNAAKSEDVNYRFVKWTKSISSPRVDRLAKETDAQVFEKIDCTRCAHCCQTLQPAFTDTDIARISRHLGQPRTDFTHTFLEKDEFGEMLMNRLPCAFLVETGHCSIYDVRPNGCRDYPNTQKSDFSQRAFAHSMNTVTCPAVYHILEVMKQRIGYRDK